MSCALLKMCGNSIPSNSSAPKISPNNAPNIIVPIDAKIRISIKILSKVHFPKH